MPERIFVHVSIGKWHDEIHHRLDSLAVRMGGLPICTIAIQENQTVPRNIVFFDFDPEVYGQVRAHCHPFDREATEKRVQETGGRLISLEVLGNGTAD